MKCKKLLSRMVDSREIVELQVKQLGCELVIRKQEAVPKPQPAGGPGVVASPPHYVFPAQPNVAKPSAPPSLPQLAAASATPAAALSPSHPPLKCPMAGTFYRSPGPGEPPFVKASWQFLFIIPISFYSCRQGLVIVIQ